MTKISVATYFWALSGTLAVTLTAHAAPSTQKTQTSTRFSQEIAPSASSYDQLRRSLKVDSGVTLDVVRQDPQTHAGRAIEFVGDVTGLLKNRSGTTVILNTENSVVNILMPSAFRDAPVMSAGNRVRVLALVGRTVNGNLDASSALSLTPLAARLAPAEATPLETSPIMAADNGTIALDMLPPATEIPISKGTRPVSSPVTSRVIVPEKRSTITVGDGEDVIEAQMPAYRSMIRRHNSKLRADQVDAIATALLQAGAATKMDPRFLAAVIAVESDFDIYCRSSSGAMGLGQIMPFNLKEAGITNAWDPVQNVWGTARLLRGHLNRYVGRADATLLAVASYNAGPGAVRRAGKKVPKGAQVQRYVWKVYYRYKSFAPEMF